jgi:hypothetical protein
MPKLVNVSMPRKKEAGQALIAAVAALGIVLMGFAGLGIDMGYMRYQKRLEQTAADAAAIAGADDILTGGIPSAAVNASLQNGFSGDLNVDICPPPAPAPAVGSVAITVNSATGPCSGPHVGNTAYVEVYVSKVQPVFFMRVLGVKPQTVTARAVAAKLGGGIGSGCLYALGAQGLDGNGTLTASECGIVDNGTFNAGQGGLTVNAMTFGVAEGSSCHGSNPCPTLNMPASSDPLAYLNNLAPPQGTPFNGTLINGPFNFPAGTYVITGNLAFGPNAVITGNGVTFYLTNGATVTTTGNPTVQLTAPSFGTYQGILFYQDPSDTNTSSLGGNASSYYNGALYFPNNQLTLSGSFSAAIVVANTVVETGNISLQGQAGLPTGVVLIKNSVLVE